jgi:Carboxypeptidase regulatory-like domain/TonB dependent receptor
VRWNCRFTVLAILCSSAFAQDWATLNVTVVDPSGATVPGASAVLTDLQRGSVNRAQTDESGYAIFDFLQPSNYSLSVTKSGFAEQRVDRLVLQDRDRQTLRMELKVNPTAATEIEVSDRADAFSSDVAAGTPLDQQFIQNLPVNGRDAQSLILLAPGITSPSGNANDFNANGLRSNTNYFTLDGVSMNQTVGGGGGAGGGAGFGGLGGGPALGGVGGGASTNLISVDAMQEMKVQTSSFAPEFGRSPGAQIVITSRGGTNDIHGSLFYYGRRTAFDANDWFANAGGYGKGQVTQNREGGTVGGPIQKNKTFYFAYFEKLNLIAPYTAIAIVPDLAARQSAPAALQPYVNAFPVPNGPELGSNGAQFNAVVSNPADSNSGSLRIDHILNGHTTLFARYSLTTTGSSEQGSNFSAPNVLTNQSTRSQLGTAGVTHVFEGGAVNDLRVNYSENLVASGSTMDSLGGAVPLSDSVVFPAGVGCANGTFSLNIMGFAGYSYCNMTRNEQQQLNVVDALTRTIGKHSLKAGLDYRRLPQTTWRKPYTDSVSFNGVTTENDYSLLTGEALNATVSSNMTEVYPTYTNFSLYGQDTWRATERTTLTYGLRWDVNPAPTAREGPAPFALSNDTIAGVTQNQPIYSTRWLDVAPRFGVAYLSDNKPGREMILRFGAGVFYDTGYGVIGGAFGGAPYANAQTLSEVQFPLPAVYLEPPGLPATRPYGQVITAAQGLGSPVIYQFDGTLEKHFGAGQMLTISAVSTIGTNLLQTQTTPSFTGAYNILLEATNGASSDYDGLQVQFRKRLSASFQTQFSYTWSHSIDSASTDFGGGFATLLTGQRADSNYDIRQNATFSGSWRLPSPTGAVFYPLRHWYLDFLAAAHTPLPFDLQGVSTETSCSTSSTTSCTDNTGLFAEVRPDWNGLPIWISDSGAPGHRRLNPAAFFIPSGSYAQGNLGRNSLRGYDFWQGDISVRRTIPIHERWQMILSAQAYNVLNHPNFANPTPTEGANLASPDFGVATRMLDQSFGSGATSLYGSGGPRSMELQLRLQF